MSFEFGMIAANTSRTRAYLAAVVQANLLPSWILILDEEGDRNMPGQVDGKPSDSVYDPDWPEANFDPCVPLIPWLDRHGLSYVMSGSCDINDPTVISLIAGCAPKVLIYSGYGGAILRSPVLDTGKKFLHVHGGYLPDFKGSTTNYYSILAEGSIGASSIFLTEDIDGGPIIRRSKFSPPKQLKYMDHIYDSAARAKVLVETLKNASKNGTWTYQLSDNSGGSTYYIIHPVLKHLAILGE